MIPLSSSLLRGQRARTIPQSSLLIRTVLTYGATEYSYTRTRIKQLSDTEQIFSRRAQVMLDDSDKVLHGLDLEGFKAIISYGLITKAGPEWIATAPLWVVGQDSLADGTITDGTNSPYSDYPAYTVEFDSGYDADGLINVFIPADGFRIGLRETRLSKWKELMMYTNCVSRIGNDGVIHVFNPTTSGTTYDNYYTLVQGRDYHNFFNKRFRRRIVSPNYITFKNHPSHDDSYTGFAKDASADLTDMQEYEDHYCRPVSNAQCTALAGALLSKYQMAAEKGAGVLPFVHFGQEIYDYVNFVDARAGDERAGNLGSISKLYRTDTPQPQFNMSLGFGRIPLGVAALQGLAAETGLTAANLLPLLDQAYSYIEQIIDILANKVDIDVMNETLLALYDDAYFRKLTVTDELYIPEEAA